MNAIKMRWCWRKDLADFRGLTDRERSGFLLVLEWFENFRLRHELEAGREAANAFWKTEVKRQGCKREPWQLDQWMDAIQWHLKWLSACIDALDLWIDDLESDPPGWCRCLAPVRGLHLDGVDEVLAAGGEFEESIRFRAATLPRVCAILRLEGACWGCHSAGGFRYHFHQTDLQRLKKIKPFDFAGFRCVHAHTRSGVLNFDLSLILRQPKAIIAHFARKPEIEA
jgi:hypothetical protein